VTRERPSIVLDAAEAAAADKLIRLLSGFPRDAVLEALDVAAYRFKLRQRRQHKPRRPSISTMIEQAEKAGKPLASITMPDGTKLDFSKAEQQGDELDQWIAKHAHKTQGH
jgi:hypothetical protein